MSCASVLPWMTGCWYCWSDTMHTEMPMVAAMRHSARRYRHLQELDAMRTDRNFMDQNTCA